ncbi:M20/M25/M40 family metallo-hydrolase [Ekhidna sp.]|uniref:M20/M25/M40 family metallo-hydrolase n=1 Tax=Ekhidna sp. TaxID=2608089 RepID=UPI0032EB7635
MKKLAILLFLIPTISFAQHEEAIKKIYDETLTNGHVYENLRVLCKDIGSRLSGSPEAAAAVEYTRQLMESYGFDTVYLQPVMVPHWVRGKKEVVRAMNSDKHGTFEMNALALGNSVGTGPEGVLAEVIEVSGIDDVNELGKKIEGKIVFYNGAMNPTIINTFGAYGGAVIQRSSGASEAAKYGAKAIIIRSVTNRQDDIPHTGSLNYKALINQIPAVAISTNDANRLSQILKEQKLNVYMETHCQQLPDVLSYNVIGELRGSEFPDEIIAVGGHLDSWDVGEGAHDDGAGCMQAIEAVRLFKALGIMPKRTLRAVMWMNEENGLRGGREYARVAKEKGEKHIAALESDSGGFQPLGFSTSGTDEQKAQIKAWRDYFLPYRVWDFDQNGGGADIGPLSSQGTLLIGLRPSTQRYFIYHHTPADVFEAVDQRELELGAASMGAMMYLLDQEGLK